MKRHPGSKIREHRELLGLSLGAYAKRAGISKSHLKRIEDGVSGVGGYVLYRLREAYGIDPNILLDEVAA